MRDDARELLRILLRCLRDAVDERESLLEIRVRDLAERLREGSRQEIYARILYINERVETANHEGRERRVFRITRLKNHERLPFYRTNKPRAAIDSRHMRDGEFRRLVENRERSFRPSLFANRILSAPDFRHRYFFISHRSPKFDDRLGIGEEEIEKLGIAATSGHRKATIHRRSCRKFFETFARFGGEEIPREFGERFVGVLRIRRGLRKDRGSRRIRGSRFRSDSRRDSQMLSARMKRLIRIDAWTRLRGISLRGVRRHGARRRLLRRARRRLSVGLRFRLKGTA